MMTDFKTDQPRGFAFLQMSNDADAERAIIETNGIELSRSPIKVSAARAQIYRKSSKKSK